VPLSTILNSELFRQWMFLSFILLQIIFNQNNFTVEGINDELVIEGLQKGELLNDRNFAKGIQ
jgi:hypothetical protein